MAGDSERAFARAALWEVWRGGPQVHCRLCAHHCRIPPGEMGKCGVRVNRGGSLDTLTYGCPIASAVDPIEKKPLFHFLPGTLSYSVATVGCNFTCAFCQNADISQMPLDKGRVAGNPVSPEEVVAAAVSSGCRSISYTYTEPTIFFEYAVDCARLATRAGLKNVFVTNGYMTREALEVIDGDLHAANVDLKSFSDSFYRSLVGARLKPVLDSIRRMVHTGIWVEVTTLLIPGHNDSEEELRGLSGFLVGISQDIPWHVSRFYPCYHLREVPPTPVSSVERALRIGKEQGLRYVYAGNIPGHDAESTRCPSCGETLVDRRGYAIRAMRVQGGRCGACGHPVPGSFKDEV